jgi:hypothetical protein
MNTLLLQDLITTASVERRNPEGEGEHIDRRLSPKSTRETGRAASNSK